MARARKSSSRRPLYSALSASRSTLALVVRRLGVVIGAGGGVGAGGVGRARRRRRLGGARAGIGGRGLVAGAGSLDGAGRVTGAGSCTGGCFFFGAAQRRRAHKRTKSRRSSHHNLVGKNTLTPSVSEKSFTYWRTLEDLLLVELVAHVEPHRPRLRQEDLGAEPELPGGAEAGGVVDDADAGGAEDVEVHDRVGEHAHLAVHRRPHQIGEDQVDAVFLGQDGDAAIVLEARRHRRAHLRVVERRLDARVLGEVIRVGGADDEGAVEQIARRSSRPSTVSSWRAVFDEVALVGAPPALLGDELGLLDCIDAAAAPRARAARQQRASHQRPASRARPRQEQRHPSRPTMLLVTRWTATASWTCR